MAGRPGRSVLLLLSLTVMLVGWLSPQYDTELKFIEQAADRLHQNS